MYDYSWGSHQRIRLHKQHHKVTRWNATQVWISESILTSWGAFVFVCISASAWNVKWSILMGLHICCNPCLSWGELSEHFVLVVDSCIACSAWEQSPAHVAIVHTHTHIHTHPVPPAAVSSWQIHLAWRACHEVDFIDVPDWTLCTVYCPVSLCKAVNINRDQWYWIEFSKYEDISRRVSYKCLKG